MSDATADQSSPLQGALSIQQDHLWSCSSFLTEPLPGMALPLRDDPLPVGWRWVRLAQLIQEAQAGFASGERDEHGVAQLRMNNVTTGGRFDWSSVLHVPADEAAVARYRLRPGDVLFNNTNSAELVGKTALFKGHDELVVYSNHFTRLRTLDELLAPSFLALWLQYQWQCHIFERISNRWIGQSAIPRGKLLALAVPLPPLVEQHRITATLDKQLAAVDRARAAAEAQLAAADGLPAAYLRAVFDGPESRQWPRRRLGDLLVLRKDVVHPHDHPRGHGTFVGLEHVESGTGARTGSVSLDLSRLTGRKPRFYRGDIVYGYLRPYLNKVWLAEFDGYCSVDQYVYTVRPHLADAAFVAWFMRSPSYLDQAPVGASPGQLPRIRTQEVASVELPLASLPEQRRVAALLTRQQAAAMQARRRLGDQLTAVEALPAGLLRRAFAGGI